MRHVSAPAQHMAMVKMRRQQSMVFGALIGVCVLCIMYMMQPIQPPSLPPSLPPVRVSTRPSALAGLLKRTITIPSPSDNANGNDDSDDMENDNESTHVTEHTHTHSDDTSSSGESFTKWVKSIANSKPSASASSSPSVASSSSESSSVSAAADNNGPRQLGDEHITVRDGVLDIEQCTSTCTSRVIYDIPRLDLYQEVTDEWSAVQSFHNVIIFNGKVHFYGLKPAQIQEMREKIVPYKHYISNNQRYDEFDHVFEFVDAPVDWTTCEETIDEISFALSPWHPDNMFHLHNDNLVPMFTNVRAAGALYKPKRLYLYDGDQERNAKAIPWYKGVLNAMFNDNLHPWDHLKSSTRQCFRHFRWGRGPLLFYAKHIHPRDASHDPYAGWAAAYQKHILQLFKVTPRVRTGRLDFPARGIHILRGQGDMRSLGNAELLVAAMNKVNITTYACCQWKDMSLADLLKLFQTADVVYGMHGAGLAHSLYMPPGGVLIEFATEFGHGNINLKNMAKHLEHNYEYPDIRAFKSHNGHFVDDTWVNNIAIIAKDLWVKPRGE